MTRNPYQIKQNFQSEARDKKNSTSNKKKFVSIGINVKIIPIYLKIQSGKQNEIMI